MSQEYDEYLFNHIGNVKKAFEWMNARGLIPGFALPNEIYNNIINHDNSKYEIYEYDAYDDYFYGKEGRDEDDIKVIDSAFDYAWLHHIHNNPHHWQYWVLQEDEGKVKPLMMPSCDIYEMVLDWWSFSWAKGDLYEIFTWYDAHKSKIILHDRTRALVEQILKDIREVLDKEKEEEENERNETNPGADGEVRELPSQEAGTSEEG